MNRIIKSLSSYLSSRHQQELKRLHFARQIRKGGFVSDEPEFDRLASWINTGDWVLDIGANVGHYTARLSELVGRSGRVVAFEPVPQTFELLAANISRLPLKNVTLLNVAASEQINMLGMSVPKLDTGLDNFYMAHVTAQDIEFSVFCLPVDVIEFPWPIKLVKIDVEGHELSALKGLEKILNRYHPVLIVEGFSDSVTAYLAEFGYSFEQFNGSPNRIFT